VSNDPKQVKLTEFEQRLLEIIRPQALESFGIAIDEVGIKRLALPEANTLYVFDRMRRARSIRAHFRAEGRREAEKIRAQAEAERSVLLAEAQKSAEETRGKAEADAAHTYAKLTRKIPSSTNSRASSRCCARLPKKTLRSCSKATRRLSISW